MVQMWAMGRGKHDMKPQRVYQIRDTRRDCAGVFTRRSRNITWKNVKFRFLHGMGLVNQFSENLIFDSVAVAPGKTSGRTTAAWADCIQVCRVSRIPTRGFLITTRRRVLVEDNEFRNTHMSAILLEDDARGWYESGCVRNMTIRGNRFIGCGEPVIHINPRNTVANDSVHRNIRIENNEFVLRGATSIKARSTRGLRVTGNTIYSGREADDGLSVQTSDCADVLIEKNVHLPLSQQ